MPQKRKPLALYDKDNKSHRSKADLKILEATEITMGTVKFTAPTSIKSNPGAYKKWREITRIYRESKLTLVTSTDIGVLSRYCLLYSEYEDLVEQRRTAKRVRFPEDYGEEKARLSAQLRESMNKPKSDRLIELVEYFTCIEGLLKLDNAINAKVKVILNIEDRIFLNPAAKVKAIPVKQSLAPKDPLKDKGFDV